MEENGEKNKQSLEYFGNPFSNYQLNTQFLYSSTICTLHYDPQHVSSSTLLILRMSRVLLETC